MDNYQMLFKIGSFWDGRAEEVTFMLILGKRMGYNKVEGKENPVLFANIQS